MILQCMTLALKPRPFTDNLYLWPSTTMHELKLRATDYIWMEEMKTLRIRFLHWLPSRWSKERKIIRENSRPREPLPPWYSRYAPLSAQRSRILDEALQTDLIPLRKTINPPNIDMNKYYKYHRNNGHTTNKCKALQDKIKELILVGHLRRFIKREWEYNSGLVGNCDSTHGRQNNHHHQESKRRNNPPSHTDINHANPPITRHHKHHI